MNDLGLEKSNGEAGKVVNRIARHRRHPPDASETINRKRWWFMSTAFPMIAGTFGPLANLLSICALVQSWRVYIPTGTSEDNGEHIPDPAWLLAMNAVSLASAIAANLFLLFNFARRIRYNLAQPLTIGLWYLSAILLLVPISLTRVLTVEPQSDHAFSQSYYYGLISTVLYMVISTLLLFNALGAYAFKAYPPSFSTLTTAQRTVMLQTIVYSLYLALGAGIFSKLENWTFLDAVYWADYTLLTIGLGTDFPVYSTVGRGLVMPYAFGGIMMVGLVVGSVRGLVLERAVLRMEKARLEKERRRWGRSDKNLGVREPQREFEAMRIIEARADRTGRYSALAMSTLTFLTLWAMGALVFWFSEAPQNWTYFEALYFTYTSLLTIGYGDFYPKSNSGKPFFVVWSLLAVPAMTILISDLGDTVVVWLKKGTIWIGKKTILPSDKSEDVEEPMIILDDVLEKEHRALRIATAIRQIAPDVGFKPPKKYTWDEWKVFIKLCAGENAQETVFLKDEGPLFSDLTETKWLVEELCTQLEHVLQEVLAELPERSSQETHVD